MPTAYMCVRRDDRGEVMVSTFSWRRPPAWRQALGWTAEMWASGSTTLQALRALMDHLVSLRGTPAVEALPQGVRERLADLAAGRAVAQ